MEDIRGVASACMVTTDFNPLILGTKKTKEPLGSAHIKV
jgi:hypothetical protein